MLSFSLVAEALTGLIYHRPSGESSKFLPSFRSCMLHLIKGVLHKKQAFQQHVVNSQKSYAAAVGQKPLTTPTTPQTFQFNAEQLTKFVANVVIQLAPFTGMLPNRQTGHVRFKIQHVPQNLKCSQNLLKC